VVPWGAVQHTAVKVLTKTNMKPSEIHKRLSALFGKEMLSRIQGVTGESHLTKATQMLKTCHTQDDQEHL
jgi:hypothetical protein